MTTATMKAVQNVLAVVLALSLVAGISIAVLAAADVPENQWTNHR